MDREEDAVADSAVAHMVGEKLQVGVDSSRVRTCHSREANSRRNCRIASASQVFALDTPADSDSRLVQELGCSMAFEEDKGLLD